MQVGDLLRKKTAPRCKRSNERPSAAPAQLLPPHYHGGLCLSRRVPDRMHLAVGISPTRCCPRDRLARRRRVNLKSRR